MKSNIIYIVLFLLSLLYRAFNRGDLLSFEISAISLIHTDILAFLFIISYFINYNQYSTNIKVTSRKYFAMIYIVTILCSVLGIMESNHVAIIFADFRIPLGFGVGCILGASYLSSDKSKYQLITMFFFIWGVFLFYSINIGMSNYFNYSRVGLLRAVDPFLFELLGYILLIFPIAIILNLREKKSNVSILLILMVSYFILYVTIIASTKSLVISAMIGVILIIYARRKFMFLFGSKKKIRMYGFYTIMIIIFITAINILFKYDSIQLFSRTSLYRFSNIFEYSSFNPRISDLNHMFDSLNEGKWVIGRGFGSSFQTLASEFNDERALAPHIAIFTPFMKCGILGFIALSLLPVFYTIKNWIISIKYIKKYIDADILLAHSISMIVFIISYSMSGGWNFNTMIIVGFNLFVISVKKMDLNVKQT